MQTQIRVERNKCACKNVWQRLLLSLRHWSSLITSTYSRVLFTNSFSQRTTNQYCSCCNRNENNELNERVKSTRVYIFMLLISNDSHVEPSIQSSLSVEKQKENKSTFVDRSMIGRRKRLGLIWLFLLWNWGEVQSRWIIHAMSRMWKGLLWRIFIDMI